MPACNGSLRTPTKSTTLPHGAVWGGCRGCGKWMPLNHEGVVKPHPSGNSTSPD